MKKILGLILITLNLFGGSNITSYIDYNSFGEIKELKLNNIVSKSTFKISEILNGNFEINGTVKEMQDFSPYIFNAEEAKGKFNVISVIGDKTIKIGGIFSNNYNKKFNINNFISMISGEDVKGNIGIYILQKFNYDNLIFIYNRKFDVFNYDVVLNNFITSIENEVANESDKNRILLKIYFIKAFIGYTKALHNSIETTMQDKSLNIFKDGYFGNSDTFIDRLKELSPPVFFGTNSYTFEDGIVTRTIGTNWWCFNPNGCTRVESFDVSKKVPLIDMYDLIYSTRVSKEIAEKNIVDKIFNWNKEHGNNDIVKEVFSNIKLNTDIKENLNKINKYGISNGKIIYYNYNLSEVITENEGTKYLSFGLIKDVGISILNFNSINLFSIDHYNVNAKNESQNFNDGSFSLSDFSINDPRINSTLYNIWIRKPSSNEPVNNNLKLNRDYIPVFNMNKSSEYPIFFNKLDTSNLITALVRKSDNELLGNFYVKDSFEDYNSLTSDSTEIYKTNIRDSSVRKQSEFYRESNDFLNINSEVVDTDSIYPMKVKSIVLDYFPTNNQAPELKYFGPIYEKQVLFVEKYEKLKVDGDNNIALDENNNTIVLNSYYNCSYVLSEPDTLTYNYLAVSTTSYHLVKEPTSGFSLFSKINDKTEKDTSVLDVIDMNTTFVDSDLVPKKIYFFFPLPENIMTDVQASDTCLNSMTSTLSKTKLIELKDIYQNDNQTSEVDTEVATSSDINTESLEEYYNSSRYLNDLKPMLKDFYNAENRIYPHSGLLTTISNKIEGKGIYINEIDTLYKSFLNANSIGNSNGELLENGWRIKICLENCN